MGLDFCFGAEFLEGEIFLFGVLINIIAEEVSTTTTKD